jgi:catechol 2,3-dioxygenase-like lactoylglutathione lyase family enzyme
MAPADTVHPKRAYLEHVALHVKDIHWHIRFFREVLGLTLRDVDGDAANPKQVWIFGGLQLIADPNFKGPEGRLAHLGVMAEDAEATIAAAQTFGVTHLEKGMNWLVLPDGLIVEILQAHGDAVARALAIDPRA